MNGFTLSEVEGVFKAPQHVLIHLCEKEIVIPDIQQTDGRGKFRRFSVKNMFEFAVALELKKYQIPLAVIKALLIVFSAFCRKVESEAHKQNIVALLHEIHSYLYIFEGSYTVLHFADQRKNPSYNNSVTNIMLGIDLGSILDGNIHTIKLERLQELPHTFASYLKIDLSTLASRTLLQMQQE